MAVVTVVALARGASEQIISNIAAMGTNTITVYPGQGMGDVRRGRIQTLTPRDLNALQGQPFVDSVSATVQTNALLRRGQKEANATIQGVSSEMFRVYGLELKKGRLFNEIELKSNAQVGVIDDNTAKLFFATEDPLGKTIIIGNVVIRVIGVLAKSDSWVIRGTNPTVFVPYTSVMTRLVNQNYLSSIVLRINDGFAAPVAENAIKSILVTRHGREDFFMQSSDTIMKSIENATRTFTLMISAIAVISLVVGGIGVMNIMLVSVTERTKEIGIRMAVGAGRGDILSQFLIEAVMVCLIGGLLGVVLSYIAGHLIMHFAPNIVLSYSLTSVIAAVMTSSVIGIVFGFMPARSASRLNPIDALARE
ncbi:MAG: ABC transporter permease [Anaerobiospirillum succiniciproducens]|nr:ABC transporter permease [Anaerobiospirillum succiniciproducens]